MADVQRTKPKPGFRLDLTHPLSRGLVAWLPFNEGGGSVAFDQSIYENNGTLTNMDQHLDWVGSPRGGALDFDGVDDEVNMGSKSVIDDLAPATFSAWVNPRTPGEGDGGGFFGKPGFSGIELRFNGPSRIQFRRRFDTTRLAVEFPNPTLNTWTFVALTWEDSLLASGVKCYFDGISQSQLSSTDGEGTLVSDASKDMVIGNGDASLRTWDGAIEDVRFYNRVLDATEIQQLYSNPYANVLRQNTTKRRLFHALWLAKQRNRLVSKVNGGLAR